MAVVVGVLAMTARKGSPRHTRFGTWYFRALCGVAATMAGLAAMRWSEDAVLFLLGALSLASAWVGRWIARRKPPQWPRLHLCLMALSYVLLVTAFYVDNGRFLPFWRTLPPLALWLGPGAVAAPFVVNALLRHPLIRTRPPGRHS